MRGRSLYLLGALLLPLVTLTGTAANAAVTCPELVPPADGEPKNQVAANMDGAQVAGGGDPDGTGTVVLMLEGSSKGITTISFALQVNGVATPLEGAHVHKGLPGATGVAALNLFGYSDQTDRSGVLQMSKCMGHELFQRPADYYVDVHNQEYPDQGAVRGRLQSAR